MLHDALRQAFPVRSIPVGPSCQRATDYRPDASECALRSWTCFTIGGPNPLQSKPCRQRRLQTVDGVEPRRAGLAGIAVYTAVTPRAVVVFVQKHNNAPHGIRLALRTIGVNRDSAASVFFVQDATGPYPLRQENWKCRQFQICARHREDDPLGFERPLPRRTKPVCPVQQSLQCRAIQLVAKRSSLTPHDHQTCRTQYAQVNRKRRLAEPGHDDQFSRRPFAVAEGVQHLSTSRMCDGAKDALCTWRSAHGCVFVQK